MDPVGLWSPLAVPRTPADPAVVDADAALSAGDLARVWAAVDASTSANTKAAYRSDWTRFELWATAAGYALLPASDLVVAAYLTDAAAAVRPAGRPRFSPATLSRWVSSINQIHTAAGFSAPGRSEMVRRALSGVRRLRRTPPKRRSPLLLADLRTILAEMTPAFWAWPDAIAAHRDAALLLMGFAGAHRRSELVNLQIQDVTVHPADGLHIRMRSSKTDQEGHGAVRALPFGRDPLTCPPSALTRWRRLLLAFDAGGRRAALHQVHHRGLTTTHCCRDVDAAETGTPHDGGEESLEERRVAVGERWLFPPINKTGRPGAGPMSGDAVAAMIQRRAAATATPRPRSTFSADICCGPGSSPRPSGPAPTRIRSCGRPATQTRRCSRCTPANTPPRRERRHPAEFLAMPAQSAVTGRPLAPSTIAGHAADWALFTDWCSATDHNSLPTDAETIAAFTTACPAAPATRRCRVAAIVHHHRAAGLDISRGATDPGNPPRRRELLDPELVATALRLLPSRGWTAGLFGLRDKALLTLAASTDLPYRELAVMRVGHLDVVHGAAAVTDTFGKIRVIEAAADPVLCGPCALTRWRRILDVDVGWISAAGLRQMSQTPRW